MTIQWREKSKHVLLSDVSARQVSVRTESKENVSFNVLCLTPTQEDKEPMFLATTLTTQTSADLTRIVRLYSWRWGIETFFWNFKQPPQHGREAVDDGLPGQRAHLLEHGRHPIK